jgi:hypothetical protein
MPPLAKPAKQQALVDKYTTKDLSDIGSVFDIVNDFGSVFDDVANPLNWFTLFNDGWSLLNMSTSRDSASATLQDLLDKVSDITTSLYKTQSTLTCLLR